MAIGVGIVGLSAAGGWAAAAHVPALAAVDGVELRALSASSAASAQAAGERFGVPLAFASAGELAQRPEVDLVVVTVKVPEHRELVRTALDAGKMVLCEWPLARDLAEAEELAARAEEAGTRSAVGLQGRAAPAVRYLRDLVAEGYVGEVLSTTVLAAGVNWGGAFSERSAYQLDPANGATMVSIPFGHTIDTVEFVLGRVAELSATTAIRRPRAFDAARELSAATSVADQLVVGGVLESGAVAAIHFRGGTSRGTHFLWEINGTNGDLTLSLDSGIVASAPATLRGARGEDVLVELPVPDDYVRLPGRAEPVAPMALNVGHAYAQLVRDVADGTALVPNFAHAVSLHRLLDEVEQSAASGRRHALARS